MAEAQRVSEPEAGSAERPNPFVRITQLANLVDDIFDAIRPKLTIQEAQSVELSLIVTLIVRMAESGQVEGSRAYAREAATVLLALAAEPDAASIAARADSRHRSDAFRFGPMPKAVG